jgi:hypothetical protein
MTFEILYNESGGAVKTAEVDADSLFEAEENFRCAYPSATYWEIAITIDADFDFNSAPHPSAHYERGE